MPPRARPPHHRQADHRVFFWDLPRLLGRLDASDHSVWVAQHRLDELYLPEGVSAADAGLADRVAVTVPAHSVTVAVPDGARRYTKRATCCALEATPGETELRRGEFGVSLRRVGAPGSTMNHADLV